MAPNDEQPAGSATTTDVVRADGGRLIIRIDSDGAVEWGADVTPADVAEALEYMARQAGARGRVPITTPPVRQITHITSAVDGAKFGIELQSVTVVIDGREMWQLGAFSKQWTRLPPLEALGPAPTTFALVLHPDRAPDPKPAPVAAPADLPARDDSPPTSEPRVLLDETFAAIGLPDAESTLNKLSQLTWYERAEAFLGAGIISEPEYDIWPSRDSADDGYAEGEFDERERERIRLALARVLADGPQVAGAKLANLAAVLDRKIGYKQMSRRR